MPVPRPDSRGLWTILACGALLALYARAGIAQPPAPMPPHGSPVVPVQRHPPVPPERVEGREPLPRLPERPSRTEQEVTEFVKEISNQDAALRVILGRGRLLTLEKSLIEPEGTDPHIAVGDPTIVDFQIIGPRQLRLTGRRIGVTDLSIITADGTDYTFLVHVVANLDLLRAKLLAAFPDATVTLTPMQQHLIVSGEVRGEQQAVKILETIEAFLLSTQVSKKSSGANSAAAVPGTLNFPAAATAPQSPTAGPRVPGATAPDAGRPMLPPAQIIGQRAGLAKSQVKVPPPLIINLLHVPGPQQVLLKVQIAELNRTAFRQLGVSMLFQSGDFAVGNQLGPAITRGQQVGRNVTQGAGTLLHLLNPTSAQLFGIFNSGRVHFLLQALRSNQVLKVLAEPNLVAMDGQQAQFLAGGEYPIPVPQPGSGGSAITIQYKQFGVHLEFVPYILDNEMIQLSVSPEVTNLDFATGVSISGLSVPGLTTRRTSTVVQLREGQTLAISGLLQTKMTGSTRRVPGLGDLPIFGSLFRNASNRSEEKELVILVTPFLVEPMPRGVDPLLPGEGVLPPDDFELYLLGRIERRRPSLYRATLAWDDPLGYEKGRWRAPLNSPVGSPACPPPGIPLVTPAQWKVERHIIKGPAGYSQ